MAFCAKCGAQVAAGTAFCPSCGAPQSASSGGGSAGSAGAAGSGLEQNLAGLLCYAGFWITGIIFLLIDKRPFVRFHAAQSLVLFGGLHVVRYILLRILFMVFGFGGIFFFGSVAVLIADLIGLAAFILWIFCMVKAYQGERFKLPFIGDIAESIAGK